MVTQNPSSADNGKKIRRLHLRLSPEQIVAIDAARAQRPGNVSRNTWIAEAIEEKLLRARKTARAERGGPLDVEWM